MIGFIVCCLSLAILVLSENPYLELLTSPIATGLGTGLMLAGIVLGYLKKVRTIVWHDMFATAGLIIWYSYWRPLFNDDTPMFFAFPIYYALMSSLVTLVFINRSADFDRASIDYVRYLDKITRFDMSIAVVLVIIGLMITRHYAFYPMAMTFFILRHTMIVCLEIIDGPIN